MNDSLQTTPMNLKLGAEAASKECYKSEQRPTWCPGCGDYGVLAALDRALRRFGRPAAEIAIVSGIGCSSRFPFFMETYGFHSAHGRALSVATGLKTARPDLTVIATGGDGDALAIGGNHFFHTLRRNVDLTYVLMDNQIYGMTKGQTAPTSRLGLQTKSTPYGNIEPPVEPCWTALTAGATFVAQAASHDLQGMTELLLAGLRHPGAAFINVLSPCVTFHKEADKHYFKQASFPVGEDYDPTDFRAALDLLRSSQERFPLGLLYRAAEPPPSFGARLEACTREVIPDATALDEAFEALGLTGRRG